MLWYHWLLLGIVGVAAYYIGFGDGYKQAQVEDDYENSNDEEN